MNRAQWRARQQDEDCFGESGLHQFFVWARDHEIAYSDIVDLRHCDGGEG